MEAIEAGSESWIAVVSRDAHLCTRLGRAVESPFSVRCFSSPDVLEATSERSMPFAIVLDLGAWTYQDDVAPLRRMRRWAPYAAIVCLCDRATVNGPTLVHLLRSGATNLLFRDESRPGKVLTEAIANLHAQNLISKLPQSLTVRLPSRGMEVLKYCFQRAHEDMTVDEIAQHFRVTRDALANRVRHAGLPNPRRLTMWAKLLVAAHMIDEGDCTLERIAHGLRLSGQSTLSRAFQHYAGLRPARVTQHQIFSRTARAFILDCSLSLRIDSSLLPSSSNIELRT